MKKIITILYFMFISLSFYANVIYINQSVTLDLDVTQDGQNNTVGSSTTVLVYWCHNKLVDYTSW